MNSTQAENRDLTDRDINQPKETHKGVFILGTDFRHAVEFSRSGRARNPAFRPSLVAASPDAAQRLDPQGSSRRALSGLRAAPRRTLHHPPGVLQGGPEAARATCGQATPTGRYCTLTRGPTGRA